MSMIYIVDGQNDRILSHIRYKYLLENDHTKSKEDWLETFQFTTFADQSFSEHLTKRNKILIPGEDDELIEFTLFRVDKIRRKGRLVIKCYSRASYLDLKKSKSIDVGETDANSAELHTINALANTSYQAGQIAFKGVRTIMFDNAVKPFNYIKRIASEFELEPRFRAQTSGGKIIGRYVDLVDRVGEFRGRTAEFGSDIETLKRKENTKDVVTALRCFGPEREDGTRLIVEVTDEEALQRWGMNGQHLWDDYEPRSTIQEMTEEELRGYGRTELDKRINAVVDYEIDIIDLEHVPGLENKKTRFGDTIHIKDTGFTPPLYVEARIFKFSRDIKNKARKRITLGDFKEFTEEEVDAAWKQLQSEIAKKIDAAQTYDKDTIDSKDQTVFEDGKTFAEIQAGSAEDNAKSHANTVANDAQTNAENHADTVASQAESNAKSHADTVASNAESSAKDYAVAQEAYDTKMTEITNDLSDKAGIKYVNGQLQLKQGEIPQQDTEPSSPNTGMLWLDTSQSPNVMKRYDGSNWVKASPTDASEVGSYTIAEVDNRLSNKVSTTQYDADMDGVVNDIQSNSTLIGQNEDAIALKADSSRVDTLEGTVEDHSASLNVMSDEISSKVEADYVQGEIDKLEVGGRNLIQDSKEVVLEPRDISHNYEILYLTTEIEQGKEYTFTADVEITDGDFDKVRVLFRKTDNNTDTAQTLEMKDNKIKFTFNPNSNDINRIFIYAGQSGSTHNNGVIYSNIKLEKGNKATDWTPAPEDTQSQIDDLDVKVTNNETSITQNADAITSKAEQSELDTLTGRVNTAESEITQNANEISQRVTETTFNSGISDAKSHADTQANNAETNAENYTQNYAEKKKVKSSTAPSDTDVLWIDTSQNPNVMKTYNGSSWVKATPTQAGEIGAETPSGAQNKADSAENNAKNYTDNEISPIDSRLTTAESSITQNADNITTKVEQTDFDTLTGRVSTAESTISQHADEIDLRVEKDGVIGSINLSEEDLKIDVEQVAIQGDLDVVDGDLVLKDGSVTAPKISSREITSEKLLLGNFDNMLENPNFLNNISPHSLQRGSWTLDNNKSHTGKTSLKCTGVDAGDEARVYLGGADAIVVQEGEQYQFSTHVIKTGNSQHSDIVISLRFADEDLNFVSFEGTKRFYSDDFSHNEWTQVTTTGTVPEGAFYVQPTIRIMDDGNNPSYQIDSVKLKSLVDGKLVAGTIESVDIIGTNIKQTGKDGNIQLNNEGLIVSDNDDNMRISIAINNDWLPGHSSPGQLIFYNVNEEKRAEIAVGQQDLLYLSASHGMYFESESEPFVFTVNNLSDGIDQGFDVYTDARINGKLTIERSGSSFNLKSEGTGSSATTYVDFTDVNDDRLGYFGYGSTGNTIFYISNNIGDEVRIVGDMNATGSKSAIVETENYGSRKMYAVEAPDVRFMDVIEVTLDQGEHWVNLNYIFAETINGYSVFPIVQNGGQVSVLERENQRFKVYVADDNTQVACWVYGKREGYEDIYLEQVEEVA